MVDILMGRRSFLRGTLVSVAAGTALVTLATAEETSQLVQGPIVLGNIGQHYTPLPSLCSPEVYIRVHDRFVCVGLIREITVHQQHPEIITWDGSVELVPGLKRGEVWFKGQREK